MQYTSAEANKLLKKLNDTYQALLYEEEQSSTFLAAMGEDLETLRPEYDYRGTQEALHKLEENIIAVKHAINIFNTTHTLRGIFDDSRPGACLSAALVGAGEETGRDESAAAEGP